MAPPDYFLGLEAKGSFRDFAETFCLLRKPCTDTALFQNSNLIYTLALSREQSTDTHWNHLSPTLQLMQGCWGSTVVRSACELRTAGIVARFGAFYNQDSNGERRLYNFDVQQLGGASKRHNRAD